MGKKAKAKRESGKTPAKAAARPTPLRSSPNWPLFAISLIGIILTSYLTWTAWNGESVKGCAVGSGCDVVLSSRWSTLLGVPTAAWGLFGYAILLGTTFIKRAGRHWSAAWIVALFGLLYSGYLTTVSLTILKAACPYCLTSLALMTSIFVLVTYQRPATRDNFSWRRWLSKTLPAAAAIILILHLHYSGVLGNPPAPTDPTARALAVHLTRSSVKFYGAYWCPHCQEQKELFGTAASLLPYVECSPGGRNSPQAPECQTAGIVTYPTWIIKGQRFEEVLSLTRLAGITGFAPAASGSN